MSTPFAQRSTAGAEETDTVDKLINTKLPESERPDAAQINEAEFWVPASDSRGHGDRMQFRVPFGIRSAIQRLLRSRKYPYLLYPDGEGAFLRHALVRHLQYCSSISGEVPSVLLQLQAWADIDFEEYMSVEFQHTFQKLVERINDFSGPDREIHTRRHLSKFKIQIERMPDGYWKDRYLAEYESRFKRYFDGAAKAKFNQVKSDKED